MDNNFVIETGNLPDVPRIIDFVIGWLRSMKLEEHSFNIETAVDEAVTNVFKHGYKGRGGYLSVTCRIKADVIEVTVADRCQQFNPASVPPPDLNPNLQERKIGGLGVYMMKKMMDEVEYKFDPQRGNELTLRRRLHQ